MFGFGPDMIYGIPGLLTALTIHEYAHARVATNLGDPTPRLAGRLTMNPVAHIDPMGLLMLFIAKIGWAKPVPINPSYFKQWKRNEIEVALAGPVANLILAFVGVLTWSLLGHYGVSSYGLDKCIQLLIIYNVYFALFNLLPIPPLDGSKVLIGILPGKWAYRVETAGLNKYSFFIMMGLLFTGVIGAILEPVARIILSVFGLITSLLMNVMFF